MTFSAKLAVIAALIAPFVCTNLSAEEAGQPAENFQNWYQVDVILFKPRNTNLDGESWPEVEATYPADVIAVTDPRVFKLSQLAQLPALEFELDEEQVPVTRDDEFVFSDQSRNRFNRRVLASIGAAEGERDGSNGSNESDDTEERNEETDGTPAETDAPTPTDSIDALLTELNKEALGQVAFSRSIDNSTLKNVQLSLRRSSRFDVLDHQSWLQPINSEPTPILFQSGARHSDLFEVEGIVSVSRSRYLHVSTDLWYTVFEESGSMPPAMLQTTADSSNPLSEETLEQYADLVAVERERGRYFPARTHVMNQSRRMRSGELHYIDHPLFGVIVRISRYEGPEPDVILSER